jgi:hypothetical protein
MSAILYEKKSTAPADIFDLLKRLPGEAGQNIGGQWAVPAEFDTGRFASAFYKEGQESLRMQQDQPVVGTNLMAPGWKVWTYPENKVNSEGKKDKEGKPIKPVSHELAGKAHKVVGDKPDEFYLLHYRDIDVQNQVNLAYAKLSHENVRAELLGQTAYAADPNDPTGLVTEQFLRKELGVDREVEEGYGRPTAVHGALPSGPRVESRPQRVSQ